MADRAVKAGVKLMLFGKKIPVRIFYDRKIWHLLSGHQFKLSEVEGLKIGKCNAPDFFHYVLYERPFQH